MSEFHYHSSDNYSLNRGHSETWNKVYSHFSLFAEKFPELQGVIERQNETLSKEEFEDFQNYCAQRGVTVIPEIEALGHALAITKWKPELALAKKDLLNLIHPDTIPTVKTIWEEFLPWFPTKEVPIGADKYDAELADDYIKFVNRMKDWVNETSGRQIRIWGTYEPSQNLNVSHNIIIQHWQYGQSDPVQLQNDGYELINSNDWWAYMSLKNHHMPILPAPWPQFYNVTRTMNFVNLPGWQWDPRLFNQVTVTEQLKPGASGNRGAILAAWSDSGPDATTQLKATSTDGFLDNKAVNLQNKRSCRGLANHLMQLTSSSAFSLTGPDTSLSIENFTSNDMETTTLFFKTADNWPYPLRSTSESDGHDPGHPGRIWTNLSSFSHEHVPVTFPAEIRIETDVVNGSRVWVNDEFKGRFEVFIFGGRNTLFSWSQMALVAPLGGIEGGLDELLLEAGIGGTGQAPGGNQTDLSSTNGSF
ncbi:hypothetical protein diail_3351 [Diaporthe ilicicola]|nr:hypothetical protein diail_3351 [Diaporthe ilicicola]